MRLSELILKLTNYKFRLGDIPIKCQVVPTTSVKLLDIDKVRLEDYAICSPPLVTEDGVKAADRDMLVITLKANTY